MNNQSCVFAGRLMSSQVSHCLPSDGKSSSTSSRTNRSSFIFWCKWAGLNNIWWICSPNENCFEIFGRPMNDFLVLRIWSVYGKQNDFARQQEFSPNAFPSVILAFINCMKDALQDFGNQETSQWPGFELFPSRKVLAVCWANQWHWHYGNNL